MDFLLSAAEEIPKSNSTSPVVLTIITSLISGIIGSIITIVFARLDAKKKLIVDISMQELLPKVYSPLINEYQRVKDGEIHKNNSIILNTRSIERVIYENILIIKFAPKEIKFKISTIYNICKSINNTNDFDKKEPRIKKELAELKEMLGNEFERYMK